MSACNVALDNPHNLSSTPTLLITTSGGGGHLQAAQAKKLELKEINPCCDIYEIDIAKAAGGKFFGYFMIDCIWNAAQRRGSVKALDLCAYSIPTFDKLFWISIFFQIFILLKKNHIEKVIDTQPMCNSSISWAVRLYNYFYQKHILIEKVLTELPTKESSHYLKPIKNLSKKNRELIRLLTVCPYLQDKQTEEAFWKTYSGLEMNQVWYHGLPIRPGFKKNAPCSCPIFSLSIKPKSENELLLLRSLLNKSSFSFSIIEDTIELLIPKNHKLITLMLGSQPHQQASVDYVRSIIDYAQSKTNRDPITVFIFCADKKFEKTPLQEKIFSFLEEQKNLEGNLTIIPLSSQPDCVIAPLYYRSQATITKAGGITSMELLSCSKGKIFIHHEASFFGLRKKKNWGMPKWEYGNALYLQQKKGATFVTPLTLSDELHRCFF